MWYNIDNEKGIERNKKMMLNDIEKTAIISTHSKSKCNTKYLEILYLERELLKTDIHFTLRRLYDGWQIVMYDIDGNYFADVVEHSGSYGSEDDLLEVMGALVEDTNDDEVQGCLSAFDILERLHEL
jgi:hypothetical protein